ncbi:hypothetical protein D3C78_1773780 [compost metagenome]
MVPPLSVTLNLPSEGLIRANSTGRMMYQANTDSYTSFQKEWRKRPWMAELVRLEWKICGST